jgi:hypothetical protein
MSDVVTIGELLAEFVAERVGQTLLEPGTFLGPFPSGAPAIFADQESSLLVSCSKPCSFPAIRRTHLGTSSPGRFPCDESVEWGKRNGAGDA